jgi:hypothetical protein
MSKSGYFLPFLTDGLFLTNLSGLFFIMVTGGRDERRRLFGVMLIVGAGREYAD